MAFVIDDAYGGCNNYQFVNKEEEQKFNDYVATLPPCTEFGEPFPVSADMFMCDLLEDYEMEKNIKRLVKKNVVYSLKGDNKGDVWSMKATAEKLANPDWLKKAVEHLQNKYGDKLVKVYNI